MSKADYVRSQKQTRSHHCHWPGCEAQVPPAMWGCRQHWYTLPAYLRTAIWNAYEPGQEKTMTPSKEYLRVAGEVQKWIKLNCKEITRSDGTKAIVAKKRGNGMARFKTGGSHKSEV